MAIKHAKVSAKPDMGDASLVQPSDWNAGHTIDNGTITAAMLAATAVTPGSYTNANITVDAQGRITAASSGSGGGGITNGAGANVLMKSDGTNAVASSWTDDGTTSTTTGAVSVGGVSTFSQRSNWGSLGPYMTTDQTIGFGLGSSGTLDGYINYYGFNGTFSAFRNLIIADGKGASVAKFTGSTKATQFFGSLQITGNVGFYGTTPTAKPSVPGSRGGNAALANLLTALASFGLITDNTTA